jgi:hypothetical protein
MRRNCSSNPSSGAADHLRRIRRHTALKKTLSLCSAKQFARGGATYTNLWTVDVPVVDIQDVLSSYNPSSKPQGRVIFHESSHVTFTLSGGAKNHSELGSYSRGCPVRYPAACHWDE